MRICRCCYVALVCSRASTLASSPTCQSHGAEHLMVFRQARAARATAAARPARS